ncbi:MAG: hypothetical protein KF915_18630 [Polyangiaceae bacterium]|nr:hypothetical protein [Polyangiaceae bacterium]
MTRRPLQLYDVVPSHVLRDEYGYNAENRPTIAVDEAQVPEHLRHLIPYVERWAIACDVTRLDYMEKQGEEAVRQFFHDVEPHRRAVDLWLDNQPEDVGAWPEAAVQFMYLLEAHDGAEPISPVRQAELEAAHRDRSATPGCTPRLSVPPAAASGPQPLSRPASA